jgi:Ca-activated chloride channel homolog
LFLACDLFWELLQPESVLSANVEDLMKKYPVLIFLIILAVFIPLRAVQADGIIIPPKPPCREDICPPLPRPISQLEIRYHHVKVTITNQLAVTHVDQVFYNPNDWPVEGTYMFPLPLDAVVSHFTLWVDGEPVEGKVLTAEEARSYYEDVVSKLRDPALLEYMGRGAVQASLFPIPPQGERRIELEYSQALVAENGLVRYVYPLNTEKFSQQPLEDVSIQVDIHDTQSIRAVYSPSHPVGLDRQGENQVTAGYEAQHILPDTDFTLYYSLGENEAFHLFSYRDPADPASTDGFFLLLLAPKPETEDVPIPKDVLLVLDHSGSMDGEKFTQAQAALGYILKKLNPGDRFYLQVFSTGIETYPGGLRPVSEVNAALSWVNRLSAVGSTDINRALLEAAAVVDPSRPTYLIFLTDGLPTQGVIDSAEILKNFGAAAPANLRLFTFGVGYDVDTVLLDTLSQEHHGQSTYVRPDEKLDEVLSAFYQRISTPVLTNLALDFGQMATYDVYPNPLPDLFRGSQVVIAGRYRQGGTTDITLTGEVNGKKEEFRFPQQVFASDSRGSTGSIELLPRLWATRKIGYLLNRIRLDGPDKETIAQIVAISVRYGIITPYTSYLVTEPMPLGAQEQERIINDAFGQAEAAPLESSGKSAVERAAQEGQMQSADVAPSAQGGGMGTAQGTAIRIVGTRTFLLQNGVWIDTAFDPQKMTAQQVVFLSDDFKKLLSTRSDLAPALALGEQVIVVVDGKAYQITSTTQGVKQLILPSPLPTQISQADGEPTTPASATAPRTQAETPQAKPVPAPARSAPCAALGLVPLAVFWALWKKKLF